jgi:WXG100 family type VII secretion target
MSLRVSVEELLVAAAAVSGLGEDLATAHASTQARMEAALPGWRGLSAVAVAERLADWASVTTVLLGRLGEYAQALRVSAAAFADAEQRAKDALS